MYNKLGTTANCKIFSHFYKTKNKNKKWDQKLIKLRLNYTDYVSEKSYCRSKFNEINCNYVSF